MSVDGGVDHAPARMSSAFAVSAAVFVLGVLVVSKVLLAVVVGVISVLIVAIGLRRSSRSLLTIGGIGLFSGVLFAGLIGVRPRAILIATVAVVLAWDAGINAIVLGERMGHAAQTRRIEIVHIAATAVVVALAAGGGYLIYQLPAGGGSPVALIILLVATVLLTVVIQR